MQKLSQQRKSIFLLFFCSIIIISSCDFPAIPDPTSQSQATTRLIEDEIKLTFRLRCDTPVPAGDIVHVTILDEVTGLAFNQQKYRMHSDDNFNFSVTVPSVRGAVLKYRYSREGEANIQETTSSGELVRYRLYIAGSSTTIDDVINGWMGNESEKSDGRITGLVLDETTHQPVPNILVSAGGERAFSHADGTFSLDGLSEGVQNLVFFSIDGSYNSYQQKALIGQNSTTPATVFLTPIKLVPVLFTIQVPKDTPTDTPIKFIGSLYQLGNTFADLAGGVSSIPSRSPVAGKLPDGRYLLTLNLPAGAYIEYKYTLGDGLWSSELTRDGLLRVRRLLIPDKEITIDDKVETWTNGKTKAIQFEVNIPQNTPPGEDVAIQFNPGFGWMEPLPMQPIMNSGGERIWKFVLTGPFNNFESIKYRYCRQGLCGIGDDVSTAGVNPPGRSIVLRQESNIIHDTVTSWMGLSEIETVPKIEEVQAIPKPPDFITGVAFQPGFDPSWSGKVELSVKNIAALDANTLILTPTWSFLKSSEPFLEPDPSRDMLWLDLLDTAEFTHQAGLNLTLFPTPSFSSGSLEWWHNTSRDNAWWITFFEQYKKFIMNYAIAASKINSSTLILGGDWINPALPGGLLSDGTASNIPLDAEIWWRELIQQIRGQYTGNIGWALSYPYGVQKPPGFIDAVDQVYILWSASLATSVSDSIQFKQAQAMNIIDQEIYPFQQQVGKPVILAISYPSITRGAMGCIQLLGGGCLDYAWLDPPNQDIAGLEVNLQDQAEAYYAVLSSINNNDWVSGIVSMGYYPPAIMQDKSISIHGKPASGVVQFWFQKYTGH